MGYIKTHGVVIKEVNLGESDKIVTLFTKSHGKLSAYAKGVRRPKSALSAGCQLLSYGEFLLYGNKDRHSVSSVEVVESFYGIRDDLEKLTYAAHMMDILFDVIQEDHPSSKALSLFLNTLHFLSKSEKSPALLTRIFEIRLLTILGYAPHVSGCMNCGASHDEVLRFSFQKCGFLCNACKGQDLSAMTISAGVAKALEHIIQSKSSEVFSFELSEGALEELEKISTRYVRERLERKYTKLDFLKQLRP